MAFMKNTPKIRKQIGIKHKLSFFQSYRKIRYLVVCLVQLLRDQSKIKNGVVNPGKS